MSANPAAVRSPTPGSRSIRSKHLTRSSSGSGWPSRTPTARGFAHGGLIAALADKAMGHSCGYKMRGAYSLVTVGMAIDFISSGQIGQWLTVETDVIKTGSTLCFAQSLIKADDAVIARANATFRVVPKKEPVG